MRLPGVLESRGHALHLETDTHFGRHAEDQLSDGEPGGHGHVLRPRTAEVQIHDPHATPQTNGLRVGVREMLRREVGCTDVDLHVTHPCAVGDRELERGVRSAALQTQRLQRQAAQLER